MSVKILKSNLHDLIQVEQHLNSDSNKQYSGFRTNVFSAVFLAADKECESSLPDCFIVFLLASCLPDKGTRCTTLT